MLAFHQQPDVTYLPCFENDDLSCRLHVFHVVCRANHHSRSRVNSSLQVVGGCKPSTVAAEVELHSHPGALVRSTQGPSWGIQKSILTDFSGNVGDSRQMLTKTRKWLQERGRDTPTKGHLWVLHSHRLFLAPQLVRISIERYAITWGCRMAGSTALAVREFFIDSLLVRIHYIIIMIR